MRSPGQKLMYALAAHVCRLTALVAVKHCCQAHGLPTLSRIRDFSRWVWLQVLKVAVAILQAWPELKSASERLCGPERVSECKQIQEVLLHAQAAEWRMPPS